jgi:hypothetical protein
LVRSCLCCTLLIQIYLIEQHGLQAHLYADDTQVLGSCLPCLSTCLDDVASWMRSNRLQLNTNKTELLWCASARRQSQLPSTPLRVGSTMVSPSSSVRNLGFYIDADLSGRTPGHQNNSVLLRSSSAATWSTSLSIPIDIFNSLVVSLVLSRLDYGNAVLCGLPQYQYRRLQSVLHAAARSILNIRRYDHVTPALIELHWLSAVDRVNFKVATLVYRCLHDLAPPYCREIYPQLLMSTQHFDK